MHGKLFDNIFLKYKSVLKKDRRKKTRKPMTQKGPLTLTDQRPFKL